jgi:hypothetical protein
VSVAIFFEGGGDKETTQSKCREGLSKYCAKLRPSNSRLKIVACGGRQQAFERFITATRDRRADEICALLVDAEGPVTASTPVQHLRARDGWDFPVLDRHKVFLMVQAMEAWFLADRKALAEFYDGGFLAKSLPGSPTDIESITKDDLEPKLRHASKPTKAKGEYHKVKHGFALLALIDPKEVEKASPHAKLFNDFLRSL